MVWYLYHDNTILLVMSNNTLTYMVLSWCHVLKKILHGHFWYLLAFPAPCFSVSCINMFVFCTGTLELVNMRVSCRCVVGWRFQQWSSVTIIHLKQSRYIYSSHKCPLNASIIYIYIYIYCHLVIRGPILFE